MNKYEFMLILNPVSSEDEKNSSIENIKNILKSAKAKITQEDIWGDKKMAYQINRSERGYYILYTLEAQPESLKEITSQLNLEKNIWRHMFVKIDD